MNNSYRFFEKALIIFNILKDGTEVPIDTIKRELNVSDNVVSAALEEFNLFVPTIKYVSGDKVKFIGKKEKLTDCATYNCYKLLLVRFTTDPEHYMSGNEVEIAKEFGVDRKIVQKIKTLIKMDKN